MCNIAGYIGPRPAAPVLLDMMSRESGFWGGYYTGLVTVGNGALHARKVLGDLDRLTEMTDAALLPGFSGLIHSRSNSGGDERWSHPFLSNDGALAYVANGSGGKYAEGRDISRSARMLEAEGVRFDTASPHAIGSYPTLSDGRGVHVSEVMCHLIRHFGQKEGLSVCEAMARAFLTDPAEIVGLCVSSEEPGVISFARFNQPMTVARTEDEVFLATSAIAFPEDREYISITRIPECSYGTVSLCETVIRRFRPPIPVEPITSQLCHDVTDAVLACLREAEHPLSVRELNDAVDPLWQRDRVSQKACAVYETLFSLKSRGLLQIVREPGPGAPIGQAQGITATRFLFSLSTDKTPPETR